MKKFSAYSYRDDLAIAAFQDDKPLILFDGDCALCSASVQFILRHDRRQHYRLATAQSPLGQALYAHYGLATRELETNVLLADGVAWLKSEGAIRMAMGLGFPWSLARLARLLPLAWRDGMYEWIARNRYRWFGRNTLCYLPSPATARRFLNSGDAAAWLPPRSMFARLVGDDWHNLPAAVSTLHDTPGRRRASGSATVTRGSGFLARIVAGLFRFPAAAAAVPLTVTMEPTANGETWTREFGSRTFASKLSAGQGRQENYLVERFGPFAFAMALCVADEKLYYTVRQWRLLGVPMPPSWAPAGTSHESCVDGKFCFDICISQPWLGAIVSYRGSLSPTLQDPGPA